MPIKKSKIESKEKNIQEDNNLTFSNQEMKKEAFASFGRYAFYKDGYFKSLIILFFTFITFSFSLYTLYYTIVEYTPPVKYFPVDNNYQLIRPIPLTENIMDENELTQYVSEITKDIFEYNYRNADTHGSRVKKHFMDRGYTDFMNYFENSDELKIVKRNGFIVETELAQPPEILRSGIISQQFKFWEYELIMRRLFIAPGNAIYKRYKVKILVMRRSQEEFESGLGVFNIITEEIK